MESKTLKAELVERFGGPGPYIAPDLAAFVNILLDVLERRLKALEAPETREAHDHK